MEKCDKNNEIQEVLDVLGVEWHIILSLKSQIILT